MKCVSVLVPVERIPGGKLYKADRTFMPGFFIEHEGEPTPGVPLIARTQAGAKLLMSYKGSGVWVDQQGVEFALFSQKDTYR